MDLKEIKKHDDALDDSKKREPLKKAKRLLIIGAFLLLLGFFAFYFNDTQQLYGNDEESILKVIHSIEGYENNSIEIVAIKDMNDRRYAGFLSNNNPGYIQFQKNKDGNYRWQHIEVNVNEAFSAFAPEPRLFMIVTNEENKIAKMQVSVNGQEIEQEFTPYKASVTWMFLPKTEKSHYTFQNYKYYDKDGELIRAC
ncbi:MULTISPECIES: hypothetical protein [Paenibacillus]|uniref:hypothetical protein n=1 Tax=Paenibacillus TaxID=44249 RepID=UPI0011A73DBD|nr:hypothetical protein [Paenibacillus sp. IHBB 10380]